MRYLFILLLLFSFPAYAGQTFDIVAKGKECHDTPNHTILCDYQIGESLNIIITDLGLPDATVMFAHSDFGDDYYGAFSMRQQCIVIARKAENGDFAYISPRSGVIYKDWELCLEKP